jgi:hypothetical protein
MGEWYNTAMKRREFLLGAAHAAALSSLGTSAVRAGQTVSGPAKLARVAIMTLNFHALLKLPDQPSSPERTLDVLDLPQMYADTYGVHNLEWQHYHLPASEPSFYREVRGRVDKVKSQVSQVVVEFGGLNVSAPPHNFLPRLQAIDLTRVWIDRCVVLGCPRIMVNQGQLTRDNLPVAVETLKAMVAYGSAHGVKITLETRGGGAGRGTPPPGANVVTPAPPPQTASPVTDTPAEPAWVILNDLIRGAGAFSNIDLGGIGAGNQQDLHRALATLLEVTGGSMHIKQSQNWDLPTALRFIADRKYDGLYSIEARGHELTRAIYDAILAHT